MGRILVLVLGLAVIAFAVKYELAPTRHSSLDVRSDVETGIKPVDPNGEHTRPRQQLDNVRDRTHELERDMQNRVDKLSGDASER